MSVATLTSGRRLAALLMGGALLGKVLGFVRELLMAHALGASLVADSFRGAVTSVLLPLVLLQNEGVPAILIPMHQAWQREGRAPQRLAALTIALCTTALALMLLIELLGRRWIELIVGGFVPEAQALTLGFVQVMALAMPASVLLNCLAAGEIALGRSRLTSIRSAVLNLSVIAGVLVMTVTGRIGALAWCFAGAFNLLGAWGLYTLLREGVLQPSGVGPRMVVAAGHEFLLRLRPLVVQPLAEQGQLWLERFVASSLAVGTVASLDYARTLTDSAVLLVSQPVGLAVLSRGPAQDVRGQMEGLARPVLAVALPASVFLAVFAPDVVRLVFARGAFGETAVLLTSHVLRGIAMGLWAATLGWILIRMLNSAGRNTRAALILAGAYAANAACNLLAGPLQAVLGEGGLVLGLGEGVRNVILLGGTALALGCGRTLLRLLALAAPPVLALVLVSLEIQQAVPGTFARLAAGGAACAAAILLSGAILLPGAGRTGLAWAGAAMTRRWNRS